MVEYRKVEAEPWRPMEECVPGTLYRLRSRNLGCGVWVPDKKGFVGVREKFGDEFLFVEFHYDTGPPFGTASPFEEMTTCPIEDLREGWSDGMYFRTNQPLFDWLLPFDREESKRYNEELDAWEREQGLI